MFDQLNMYVTEWYLMLTSQEASEGRMAHNNGLEQSKWNGNHVFDVFDTIPLVLLQLLPQARSPQLMSPRPPVVNMYCMCLSVSRTAWINTRWLVFSVRWRSFWRDRRWDSQRDYASWSQNWQPYRTLSPSCLRPISRLVSRPKV